MEYYHIKHQHQETTNYSKQLCKLPLAAHKIPTLNIYTMKPKSFQWTPISNFMLLNLNFFSFRPFPLVRGGHSISSFSTSFCLQCPSPSHQLPSYLLLPHLKIKFYFKLPHLKILSQATQLKQLTQTQIHPLHEFNAYLNLPKNMKAMIYHDNEHTNIIISKPDITPEECRENLKHIYTTITSQYLSSTKNKVTNTTPYDIHSSKQTLPHHMCTKLAQLRANKSLLQSYLHTVNPDAYMPQCPLYLTHTHHTNHLFNCSQVPTQHNTTSL